MKLAVLNPGGNDRDQAFPDFAGAVDDRIHAPVNYHGYAACTAGSFHRKISSIAAEQRDVLLLIRWDLALCLKTLKQLKTAGKTVAVSLKESGLFQFAELILSPSRIALFQQICGLADGCLSSTPDLVPIYHAAGARRVEFIPTPYPIDDPRWDFSVPFEQREGIFIGTREFEIPSRNHLAALLIARELGEKTTVLNVEDRPGRKRLEALNHAGLRVVEGPIAYSEYLRLMAQHRLVFQLDCSAVPGQVAGDALLCRVPCVGGDGAIEKIVFPETNGSSRTVAELRTLADAALSDQSNSASAPALAMEHVSFSAVAARLREWFASVR